jgi:hypothetical protein
MGSCEKPSKYIRTTINNKNFLIGLYFIRVTGPFKSIMAPLKASARTTII